MTRPGFEKIQHSSKSLFGPRKLLLCGFAAEAQSKFRTLLAVLGIADLPLIWISQDQAARTLHDLVELPDGSGETQSSGLPRAIIVSGITEMELHQLMAGCRQAGLKQVLWAALTPTSVQWPLEHLLAELAAEREALQDRRKNTT
jgi:Domain of unknown function (DUF3783)